MSAYVAEEAKRHLLTGQRDELAVDGDQVVASGKLVVWQHHEGLLRVGGSQRRRRVEWRRRGTRGSRQQRRDGVFGEVVAVVDETDRRAPGVGEGESGLDGRVSDAVVVEAEPVGSGGFVRRVEKEVRRGGRGRTRRHVVGDERENALNRVLHSTAFALHGHVRCLSDSLQLHREAGEEEVLVLRPHLLHRRKPIAREWWLSTALRS